jgi:NAD(P)H-hydrate epimerase
VLTVVSADEMRWCDAATINSYGIPGLLLMENAGSGVARFVEDNFGPVERKNILVFCGKGNNGGDGFVAARHLVNQGAHVQVVLLASPKALKGDAKTNYDILAAIAEHTPGLSLHQYGQRIPRTVRPPDLIIDALLGTGFSGAVRDPIANAISWMNDQDVPIVAADIPSGVDATTGCVENIAVDATATVTFGYLKTGLLINRGQDCAGDVHLADIGIPRAVTSFEKLKTFLVEQSDVRDSLPRRASTVHKYSVGKVLVLAGSKGYTGAAALTTMAALRSGAGAVMLATPDAVYPILARKLTESIVIPLPSTPDGTLSSEALPVIREKMKWADVVVVGPGLSLQSETEAVIQHLLLDNSGKMLVDADGLNALASLGLARLRRAKGDFILTPHTGEFSKLTGLRSESIDNNRIEVVRKAAAACSATVVLKGGPTVTANDKGSAWINSTGNPGMATVGSGDVLSGITAGLWAQGMEETDAAIAGVFLHGLSGNLVREKLGERSLVARDLIDFLPQALRQVERE